MEEWILRGHVVVAIRVLDAVNLHHVVVGIFHRLIGGAHEVRRAVHDEARLAIGQILAEFGSIGIQDEVGIDNAVQHKLVQLLQALLVAGLEHDGEGGLVDVVGALVGTAGVGQEPVGVVAVGDLA